MKHTNFRSLRVHPNTTPSDLKAAIATLKAANSATQSWRQAGQIRQSPGDIMQVISVNKAGKSFTDIILERTSLSRAMNIVGFAGAAGDSQLNPGVELDTIAQILNEQTVIRRGHVPDQKPGDLEGLVASFSDPDRMNKPVIEERMGISPKGIPLEGVEACLTMLGVEYTIEEDANTAPHALIADPDSIIKVLQCTEYAHYEQPHASNENGQQTAAVSSSGNVRPSPPLGQGFILGQHSL